jgi:hypothetical protein
MIISGVEVRTKLLEAIQRSGNLDAFALKHDIDKKTVMDTLRSNYAPPPKVLSALKLERIIAYRDAA